MSAFLLPSEQKLFRYARRYGSKLDIIDADGIVYSHINDFKNKDQVKQMARRFKYVFKGIHFKIITSRNSSGRPTHYSLYADILTFWNIPVNVCLEWTPFNKANSCCQKCSNYQKCINLFNKKKQNEVKR
jgi:hypothetical protein